MSEITQEIFEALPEAVQGAYEQQGEVFVSIDSLKLAALKGKLDSAYGERDEFKGKLTAQEQAEADKIAAADKAAYERAVKENDFESQNKILNEKLADAERRSGETELKYQERLQAIAGDKKKVVISEISQSAVGSKKAAMQRLLKDYVSVDPETGEETYLNDDGSASTLNRDQFIASLPENEVFKSLVQASPTTTGGGLAQGNNGSSAPVTSANEKKEAARKKGDVTSFLNLSFQEQK